MTLTIALAMVGLELVLGMQAMTPVWAAATNGSEPGTRALCRLSALCTLLPVRYGGNATSMEVMNKCDGLAYFDPQGVLPGKPSNSPSRSQPPFAAAFAAVFAAGGTASPHFELFGLPTAV